MNVAEKIYYTWLILVIPCLPFAWMFFDEDENKHPIIQNVICTFIWLPLVIGLVLALIQGIVRVWQS